MAGNKYLMLWELFLPFTQCSFEKQEIYIELQEIHIQCMLSKAARRKEGKNILSFSLHEEFYCLILFQF